ncbi:MAG: chemotaxis protein CheW [Deltaproteobacteria bacterium]|nr:chemotaxis protein CheW [Deltaproteobacteria bacterium]
MLLAKDAEVETQEPATALRKIDLLSFRLRSGRYALPAPVVTRVDASPALVRVPGAPPFVAGVAQLGGRVLTVIDLGLHLGLGPASIASPRVISLQIGERRFAALVDSVDGLSAVDETAIRPETPPVPELLGRASLEDGSLVAVLNPDMIVSGILRRG